MNKVIGVAAHVDAGKTTFSEGLLYHTNTIREMGRVDYKNSYLDKHRLEKERGITIFSDQAVMEYKGDTYYLLDTPGHVDFSPEMERTLKILDYVIIIVSAVEGIQGHTETVWQLVDKHQIPAFFFINKTDREGADVERVLAEIKENLTRDICHISSSLKGNLPDKVVEFAAERNEKLLQMYLNDDYSQKLWINQIQKMIKENKIYIAARGSALKNQGICEFLDIFHELTVTNYSNEENFKARIYKISHDENENRISHVKILSGKIKVKDKITYKYESEKISEKVNQIRIYNGEKYKTIDCAEAGQLAAIMGLTESRAGQGLGDIDKDFDFNIIPALRSKVIFDESSNVNEIIRAFRILNEEDPSLKVNWEEDLQELHIQVMGPIQLEIMQNILKDRFGLKVEFGEPGIIYKETIKGEVSGYGHFEPLKHYAEVYLKIEAGKRNSGIVFKNECSTDDLSKGNQNLVKQHLFEKEHKGLLTGSPLTDLKITLLTGRAHHKHTSGGDFREATYRALRQGLEKADNILLEPYYDFTIKVDSDYMGKVLSDIEKASGTFEPPVTDNNKFIIKGNAPVSTFMNYSKKLATFTEGKGMINLTFSGYKECHNAKEVIDEIDYDKDADPEYTSSSIFCAKGQGYVVPWYKAEEKMHCL
ncbi:MAG: GTP-binding protein [Halanaerobiaceae bacterium]